MECFFLILENYSEGRQIGQIFFSIRKFCFKARELFGIFMRFFSRLIATDFLERIAIKNEIKMQTAYMLSLLQKEEKLEIYG